MLGRQMSIITYNYKQMGALRLPPNREPFFRHR